MADADRPKTRFAQVHRWLDRKVGQEPGTEREKRLIIGFIAAAATVLGLTILPVALASDEALPMLELAPGLTFLACYFAVTVAATLCRSTALLATLLAVILLADITQFVVASGGIYSPALAAYSVVAVLAIMLGSERSAMLVGAITAGVTGWMALQTPTVTTLLPTLDAPAHRWTSAMIVLIVLIALVGIFWLAKNARAVAEARAAKGIEEAQLLASKAAAADTAKGQFLAMMSHEIRTPLSGIVGPLTLLRKSALNDEQRHWLATVTESTEVLLGTLTDVLDLSKIDAERMEIRRSTFSLRDLCSSCVQVAKGRVQGRPVAVSLVIRDDVPLDLNSDAQRLRQILGNLLSNAAKYTDRGSIRLEVALAGDHVQFVVADSGIGIDPSALPTILDPFVQTDEGAAGWRGGDGESGPRDRGARARRSRSVHQLQTRKRGRRGAL